MQYTILFSPSEEKLIGGDSKNIESKLSIHDILSSLFGGDCVIGHRLSILKTYREQIQNILDNDDIAAFSEIYGTKILNRAELELLKGYYLDSEASIIESIRRYQGVAFKELDFNNLSQNAKDLILDKVLIFSNLFGVIRASDKIPYYKLKQGTKAKGLMLKDVYKPFLSVLDSMCQSDLSLHDETEIKSQIQQAKSSLRGEAETIFRLESINTKKSQKFSFHCEEHGDEAIQLQQTTPHSDTTTPHCIIDLRASIYTKIWNPKPPTTHLYFDFYSKGKKVSHYAKLYRGKLLALIAEFLSHNIDSNFTDLMQYLSNLHKHSLGFIGIKEYKNMQILEYDIVEWQ